MTNREKSELRSLVKQGLSFSEIRDEVDCSDSTIRQYIKVFAPKVPKLARGGIVTGEIPPIGDSGCIIPASSFPHEAPQ